MLACHSNLEMKSSQPRISQITSLLGSYVLTNHLIILFYASFVVCVGLILDHIINTNCLSILNCVFSLVPVLFINDINMLTWILGISKYLGMPS
jgi:hypothetical protein